MPFKMLYCHSIRIFCKDLHKSLKYVDEFSELKKMTKFKKNAHPSLFTKYTKCRTKADAHDKMDFQYISISVDIVRSHARIYRGYRGSGPNTPEKSQKYRISWQNSWTGSLEIRKSTKQASIQRWAIMDTPAKRHLKAFRWRADDGPLLVIFGSSLP